MSIAAAKRIYHFTGLSTDTKLIPDDICTGSTFLETDTGITYVYNSTKESWIKTSQSTEIDTDAICVGIKEIKLTSTVGLIDTYTIYYTNGAETTFTICNGNALDVNENIEPIVENKLYTVTVGEDLAGTGTTYTTTGVATFESTIDSTGKLTTASVDYTKYWPRIQDGTFFAKLPDNKFIRFDYINSNEETDIYGTQSIDMWAANVANTDGTVDRYVGKFVFDKPYDISKSDYHFEATKQTITFDSLEAEIADLYLKHTAMDTRVTQAEADIKELQAQDERITNLEADLAKETARAYISEKAIRADFDGSVEELEEEIVELGLDKADKFNENQTIINGGYQLGFRRTTSEKSALETALDVNLDKKTYTTQVKTMVDNDTIANNLSVDVNIAGNYTETVGNKNVEDTEKTIGNKTVTVVNKLTETATTAELNAVNTTANISTKAVIITPEAEINVDKITETVTSKEATIEEDTLNATKVTATITETTTANLAEATVSALNMTETLTGDETINAVNSTETLTGTKTINTPEYRLVSAGDEKSATVTVKNDGTITVDSDDTITIGGESTQSVIANALNMTLTVDGNVVETIAGSKTETISGDKTETGIANYITNASNSTETITNAKTIAAGTLVASANEIDITTDKIDCTASEVALSGSTLTLNTDTTIADDKALNTNTILPKAHNTYDLGNSAKAFRDLYLANHILVTDANNITYILQPQKKAGTIALTSDIDSAGTEIRESLTTTAATDAMLMTVFGKNYNEE